MKADKKELEGQLDIFEAMNRAAAAVDRMVEADSAAKKKQGKVKENGTAEQSKEVQTEPESKAEKVILACDMHASMQKTFVSARDDDFAMIAYIDYNMVYYKNWNAPASLKQFETAKEAVDFYITKLEQFRDCGFAEIAGENEPFCNMKYVVENLYVESED